MKKIALVAAIAALSACAPSAEEAPTEVATATAAAAATPVAWTGFEPGNYTVTTADGQKMDFVLTADSYTATMADGVTETGTLVLKDGKGCMTPEGGAERCYTNSIPGPDGSWVGTDDDGVKSTIVRKPA